MGRKLLRRNYNYNRKRINSIIMRIRYGGRKPLTVKGFKTYIFKSMKDIVEKNILNYLNLLKNSRCRNIPEYDEVLSECYIVFDKCLEKYKVSRYNNFYYYFNKALSRNFFRCYQKEEDYTYTELTQEMENSNANVHDNRHIYTEELLFNNLRLNRFERAVCRSKLRGERSTEFLKNHRTATKRKYDEALKHIKEVLTEMVVKEGNSRWIEILT